MTTDHGKKISRLEDWLIFFFTEAVMGMLYRNIIR